MGMPTDPLPEPFYWDQYSPTAYAVRHSNRPRIPYWTFNPREVDVEYPLKEAPGVEKPDLWIVRKSGCEGDNYICALKTRDEATHYISCLMMLGEYSE